MTWTPGNMYSGHVPREPHTSWDGIFICTYAPILKYQWLLMVKGSLFPTILSYFIMIILWLYSPFNTTGSAMPGEGSATLNFRWHDSRIFRFLAWFWDSWIDSCDSYLPKKGSSITWFWKYSWFVIQESLLDSLIPAVIPRAINVIWNSCGPLDAKPRVYPYATNVWSKLSPTEQSWFTVYRHQLHGVWRIQQ